MVSVVTTAAVLTALVKTTLRDVHVLDPTKERFIRSYAYMGAEMGLKLFLILELSFAKQALHPLDTVIIDVFMPL